MSHRGRINAMVNLVGIDPVDLFTGLEDVDPRSTLGSGDVKYHLGATGRYRDHRGREVDLHLVSNPSHLEAVDPVLLGRARARQARLGDRDRTRVLPICLHGDAAFAGQGVTAEALNLSELPGYEVGGCVHIVLDNRIGFTAEAEALQSTAFSSDLGRRLEIPILRVHGEDPAAIVRAAHLAIAYRQRFHTDLLIDLFVYRRHGHSEVEDPTTTSPQLYQQIRNRPPLHRILADRMGRSDAEVEAETRELTQALSAAQKEGRRRESRPVLSRLPAHWNEYFGGPYQPDYEVSTACSVELLERLADTLLRWPEGFTVHAKVRRLLDQRAAMLRGEGKLDYGAAECAAFAATADDGYTVRLSGQDCRRGTFNHRNATIFDQETGEAFTALESFGRDPARVEIIDSPLSEEAVLAYEYGYSRDCPDGLVLWEAQFGDFANGAQIPIDQFLAAGEDKWGLLSGLTLLLPHGYEGQGPEHSSARIERFLTLASKHNLQISAPTTAAQYFHLLRRQVLRRWRKPLVVFTPKGMLRAKAATSPVSELVEGSYHRVLEDHSIDDATRILICCGKIVHELRAHRHRLGDTTTAILSLEDLYPFPETELRAALAQHPRARKVIWVQEEPANMGARFYVRPEIDRVADGRHVTTVKRSASASPATGSTNAHRLEQETLLRWAFR